MIRATAILRVSKLLRITSVCDNLQWTLIHSHAGVNTAYVERHSEDAFIARQCDMIPIEWAVRRQPFASFLRRNPHMKAGQICCPPPVELSFKVRSGGSIELHICLILFTITCPPSVGLSFTVMQKWICIRLKSIYFKFFLVQIKRI